MLSVCSVLACLCVCYSSCKGTVHVCGCVHACMLEHSTCVPLCLCIDLDFYYLCVCVWLSSRFAQHACLPACLLIYGKSALSIYMGHVAVPGVPRSCIRMCLWGFVFSGSSSGMVPFVISASFRLLSWFPHVCYICLSFRKCVLQRQSVVIYFSF
jgi:hypothetical protein